jgi:DNA polymerase-3 subunit delta'
MMQTSALCPWLERPFGKLARAVGEGQLNLAYVLAEQLLHGRLDERPPTPASPRAIVAAYAGLADSSSAHADLHRVRAEESKQSIGIEQIREMCRNLSLTPHLAGCKLVIIESAERMTTEAANALLKTLEEPTANTYLFLTSARPGRLPATIRSRCQRLVLRAPRPEALLAWLAADGLAAQGLPSATLAKAPIRAARDLMDLDNIRKYKEIYSYIDLISDGTADPHEVVERWRKSDLELALSCLVDRLQQVIRERLVPELRNRITDESTLLPENYASAISIRALFASLEMAENLCDQFGRGINMELALKVLLLGLAPLSTQRQRT